MVVSYFYEDAGVFLNEEMQELGKLVLVVWVVVFLEDEMLVGCVFEHFKLGYKEKCQLMILIGEFLCISKHILIVLDLQILFLKVLILSQQR